MTYDVSPITRGSRPATATTRAEARIRFRNWLGFAHDQLPPAELRVKVGAVQEMIRSILGDQFLSVIIPDNPQHYFSSTTVGIIRTCWDSHFGDETEDGDIELRDEELDAFVLDLARTSSLVEGASEQIVDLTSPDRDCALHPDPTGTAEIQAGRYGWWKTDPDFLALEGALARDAATANAGGGTSGEMGSGEFSGDVIDGVDIDGVDIDELIYEIEADADLATWIDDAVVDGGVDTPDVSASDDAALKPRQQVPAADD